MSFWNKNALPPELRDLPAEEIAKRLQKANELETELTQTKEKLKTTEGSVTSLQSTVAELQEKVKNIPPPKGDEPPPKGDEPPPGAPGLADWLADPQSAFNRASQPLAAATLISGALTAKMVAADFLQKQDVVNRRLWKKYEGEVQQLMEKIPAERRIFPQEWVNQFTFVKGMHLDEVIKEAQGQGDAFFAESATPGGSGITQPPSDDKISPEEEKVMRALKMKPEDWIKRRKSLKIHNA